MFCTKGEQAGCSRYSVFSAVGQLSLRRSIRTLRMMCEYDMIYTETQFCHQLNFIKTRNACGRCH